MKSIKRISYALMAIVFLGYSCSSDDDKVNPGTAPELPPVSSMQMDFSQFDNNPNNGGREMSGNWQTAAFHVGVWNTVLTVNMLMPVISFKAAVSQQASYDADRGLWVWSFDHDVLGKKYGFELTGQVLADGVAWKMYVSLDNSFEDVLWYSGFMSADGSEGYWLLNKDADNTSQYLRIDWKVESEETAYLKYTNVDSSSDNYEAYIEYGKMAAGDYTRYYNIVGGDGSAIMIEWNHTSGIGRYNVDGNAYVCWNESFDDVEC